MKKCMKIFFLVLLNSFISTIDAEILPPGNDSQLHVIVRLRSGGQLPQDPEYRVHIKPSVIIEKSPVTRDQFNRLSQDLQNNFNQLRIKEKRKKKRWSFDRGEFATEYLAAHNYPGLAMLLAEVADDDTYKQGWVRTLGKESLHPLLLFEWSKMLVDQKPLEALSYYLFGCRRLAEDVKRVYGGSDQQLVVLNQVMYDFTSKYGPALAQMNFTNKERRYALGQMKELYRDWKRSNGKNKCDDNLVDGQWLTFCDRKLPVVDSMPELSNPISQDHFLGNGIIDFLREGPLDQLFGLVEPDYLIARLTRKK